MEEDHFSQAIDELTGINDKLSELGIELMRQALETSGNKEDKAADYDGWYRQVIARDKLIGRARRSVIKAITLLEEAQRSQASNL